MKDKKGNGNQKESLGESLFRERHFEGHQSISSAHEAFAKELKELLGKHGYDEVHKAEAKKMPKKIHVVYKDKDCFSPKNSIFKDRHFEGRQSVSSDHEAFIKEMRELLAKHGYKEVKKIDTDKMPVKVHVVYDEDDYLSALGVDFQDEYKEIVAEWKYMDEDKDEK